MNSTLPAWLAALMLWVTISIVWPSLLISANSFSSFFFFPVSLFHSAFPFSDFHSGHCKIALRQYLFSMLCTCSEYAGICQGTRIFGGFKRTSLQPAV